MSDPANVRSHPPDEATEFLRETLYCGPVYRKLYELRQRRPDLTYELNDLAMALRQMGDRVETFLRERMASDPAE